MECFFFLSVFLENTNHRIELNLYWVVDLWRQIDFGWALVVFSVSVRELKALSSLWCWWWNIPFFFVKSNCIWLQSDSRAVNVTYTFIWIVTFAKCQCGDCWRVCLLSFQTLTCTVLYSLTHSRCGLFYLLWLILKHIYDAAPVNVNELPRNDSMLDPLLSIVLCGVTKGKKRGENPSATTAPARCLFHSDLSSFLVVFLFLDEY